jgi:hypothetical protein
MPEASVTEADLNRIADLKAQLRRRNASFTRPATLSEHLLKLIAANLPQEDDSTRLSDEAIALIYPNNPLPELSETLTFKDTAFASPIFLPIIFHGKQTTRTLDFSHVQLTPPSAYRLFRPDSSVFAKEIRTRQSEDNLITYVEKNFPNLIKYSFRDVPKHKIVLIPINVPSYEEVPLPVVHAAKVEETEAPPKFIPDRLYWTSAFESSIQFAQNYISPNWYKGGSSNINIFTRNYLKYDYNKDFIQLTNEAEIKANIYNAPNDTLHDYKIGDDIIRLHSALGIKAFPKWYYTLDAEFRTQMFTNYQENQDVKQAALLAPLSFNLGIGMKYDLEKTFQQRGKNLKLSFNVAPFSVTYMKSFQSDIDLGRHGFKKDPLTDTFKDELTRLGSTVRGDMTMNFNRHTSWVARVYYFTTYENAQCEFENTLTFAISRFFSTVIYLHVRFDDSTTKKPEYDSYYQINERLSFGFNYKW